jgi:hypothetical protein
MADLSTPNHRTAVDAFLKDKKRFRDALAKAEKDLLPVEKVGLAEFCVEARIALSGPWSRPADAEAANAVLKKLETVEECRAFLRDAASDNGQGKK